MSRISNKYDKAYYRAAIRSLFVSLFWVIIKERKKQSGGFTFQALAKAVGSTKHEISRWFNSQPNWTLNTIANLAYALDVELIIQARQRATGVIYTPAGIQASSIATTKIDTLIESLSRDAALPTGTAPVPVFKKEGWQHPTPETSSSGRKAA
jgi:transcriptional regulator with XRE-family HTH domain